LRRVNFFYTHGKPEGPLDGVNESTRRGRDVVTGCNGRVTLSRVLAMIPEDISSISQRVQSGPT